MTALMRLRSLLAAPDWRPRREIDAEIREEFAFHREMLARELEREGLSTDEAMREARRRFGDEQRLTQECRTIINGSRTMIKLSLLLIGVGFIGSLALGMQDGRRSWSRLAPFSDVRWNQDTPEILHEGRWFALSSVNGVTVEMILAHCAAAYPGIEKKRFSEDLVDVLGDMGRKPSGAAVNLEVRSLDDGAVIALENVALTSENRRAVWTSNLERAGPGFSPRLDGGVPAAGADRWSRQTPFTGLRWRGTVPEVEIEGAWYELQSANGIKTSEMLAYCADEFPGKERERFSEDFADVLKGLGALEGTLVDLGLRDAATGELVTRAGVPLSAENRRRVREFNRAQGTAEDFSAEESAAVRAAAGARKAHAAREPADTPWRAYTREFIARFGLEEGQSALAWRLCDRCEAEKDRFLAANEDEIRDVRERLAMAGGEGETSTQIKEQLKRRMAEFDGAVERIFEKRLKPGLEKIPTRAQRARAESTPPQK